MKNYLFFLLVIGITPFIAGAQQNLPTDYLSKEFHQSRRDSMRALMPANSMAVVFAYPMRTYSNDVEYNYHANPDLYYLTGYLEPNAVLFIFKEPQQLPDGRRSSELFFVQHRDPKAEQWTGRRLGKEGVKEQTGMTEVYNGSEFAGFPLDPGKFDSVIIQSSPQGLADEANDSADLYDLVRQFFQKADARNDQSVYHKFNTNLYREITGKLREIKTPEEIALLRKAIEISCIGQQEVIKAVRPGMSEMEIQGLHEFVHKKYGAESLGYPSIVGAGANGCVLHYTSNNNMKIANEMVLMDVGAEYHGYSADVTRTAPANGKFSPDQKAIYEIVYRAQEESFKLCKEGALWSDIDSKSREVVADGLIRLGIIKKREEAFKYYPHGLGHHIGLDVHDIHFSPRIKKGMVLTVEPGIYIPEGSPCDKKWWGIGVRIEDDVLIREKDFELLSSLAPRKIEDIEKMAAEKSPFENYQLPKLSPEKKSF